MVLTDLVDTLRQAAADYPNADVYIVSPDGWTAPATDLESADRFAEFFPLRFTTDGYGAMHIDYLFSRASGYEMMSQYGSRNWPVIVCDDYDTEYGEIVDMRIEEDDWGTIYLEYA